MDIVAVCGSLLLIYLIGAIIFQVIVGKWFYSYYEYGAAVIWPFIIFIAILKWIYYKV